MAKVEVKLNSVGVDALLKSGGVGSFIEGLARGRAGGRRVSRVVGRSRQNVRIHGGLDDDAKNGSLSRLLGG